MGNCLSNSLKSDCEKQKKMVNKSYDKLNETYSKIESLQDDINKLEQKKVIMERQVSRNSKEYGKLLENIKKSKIELAKYQSKFDTMKEKQKKEYEYGESKRPACEDILRELQGVQLTKALEALNTIKHHLKPPGNRRREASEVRGHVSRIDQNTLAPPSTGMLGRRHSLDNADGRQPGVLAQEPHETFLTTTDQLRNATDNRRIGRTCGRTTSADSFKKLKPSSPASSGGCGPVVGSSNPHFANSGPNPRNTEKQSGGTKELILSSHAVPSPSQHVPPQQQTSSISQNFSNEIGDLIAGLKETDSDSQISLLLNHGRLHQITQQIEESTWAEVDRVRQVDREKQQKESQNLEQIRKEKMAIDRKRKQEDEEDLRRREEETRRIKQEQNEKREKQDIENEEKLRKSRERREKYKEETKQLHEENVRKNLEYLSALLKCIQAKIRFEGKEQEWSNWLATLQASLSRAKSQFSEFQHFFGHGNNAPTYDMKFQTEDLHETTLNAYQMMYKAWKTVCQLSEEHPDRIFLKIVLEKFGVVCNKLCTILKAIDDFEINGGSIETIRDLFGKFNAFDIPTTQQLREISIQANDYGYQNISHPMFYSKSSQETGV